MDPAISSIGLDAIKQHFVVIGVAQAKEKDDLTKIRGIGPWIEKRLSRIKIFTFRQIAKMTPEIEDAVNIAIKYFRSRATRRVGTASTKDRRRPVGAVEPACFEGKKEYQDRWRGV